MRSIEADVLVIGAGPAGAHAALAAASAGLDVQLIDEAPAAGGQIWRALPHGFTASDRDALGKDFQRGEALRLRLAQSRVRFASGRRVWMARSPNLVEAVGPEGNERYAAKCLIAGTGTTERLIPFEGSTLPGIVGLAAATLLLKSQKVAPGRRTLVAGTGPLLTAVAVGILRSGGEVPAVVDLKGRADWLAAFPAMAQRPGLLAQGAAWRALLVARGIPYLHRHKIVRAEGKDGVERVALVSVDADGLRVPGSAERSYEVDAVTVGHGLTPATEIVQHLGGACVFDDSSGAWIPTLDAYGRTSVANLYAAGDSTGVSGADAACLQGELAGLAAAADLGAIGPTEFARRAAAIVPRLVRMRAFGQAMARLMKPGPGLVSEMTPSTVVCRCEDVSRSQLDAAFADGARSIGQLKSWTRCGMGPCQGRFCGDAVAGLALRHGLTRSEFGRMVARAPFRPVQIGDLTGAPAYNDIPIPPPLPAS